VLEGAGCHHAGTLEPQPIHIRKKDESLSELFIPIINRLHPFPVWALAFAVPIGPYALQYVHSRQFNKKKGNN
jgi:hypothetical protein